jgi:hypothetical protein
MKKRIAKQIKLDYYCPLCESVTQSVRGMRTHFEVCHTDEEGMELIK